MGKIKEIWNGEHKSFVRYAFWATIVFLIYIAFLSKDSLVRWAKAGIEIRQQEKQIEMYQTEIDKMDAQIKMLSNDRDTLESFARENFGFAKPGDDVYVEEK